MSSLAREDERGNIRLRWVLLDFSCVEIKKNKRVWWRTDGKMLIFLLQREATQRDVERERRQRMEAEARVREATAEAERARSRVHHLQRELAR